MMIGRVGRKRKSIPERKIDIYNEVGKQTVDTSKFATVYSIARALGMTPSTHLYKLCRQMVTEDEIDMVHRPGERVEYKFYFSLERIEKLRRLCELPYKCTLNTNTVTSRCKGRDGKLCVIEFIYSNTSL